MYWNYYLVLNKLMSTFFFYFHIYFVYMLYTQKLNSFKINDNQSQKKVVLNVYFYYIDFRLPSKILAFY